MFMFDELILAKDWPALADRIGEIINKTREIEDAQISIIFGETDILRQTDHLDLCFQLCVLFGQGTPDEAEAQFWAEKCLNHPDCTKEKRHWIRSEALQRWVRHGDTSEYQERLADAKNLLIVSSSEFGFAQQGNDSLLIAKIYMGHGEYGWASHYMEKALSLYCLSDNPMSKVWENNCHQHRTLCYALLGNRKKCLSSARDYCESLADGQTKDKHIRLIQVAATISTGPSLSRLAKKHI
ncbi:hypothetical protein LJC07_02585 [Christensenellaceae bacterium OttesenSCG-928-L17]|nr:hypothetical protein [Christensenellaceae bacterium OttesenSCG-928-L17]